MSISLKDVQLDIEKQLQNSKWFLYPEKSFLEEGRDLAHAVTGLNEEAGEVGGLLKKQIFRHKEKTDDEWKSELGDVLWYLMAVATLKNLDIEDIWKYNCDKLDKRRKTGMKGKNTWEG